MLFAQTWKPRIVRDLWFSEGIERGKGEQRYKGGDDGGHHCILGAGGRKEDHDGYLDNGGPAVPASLARSQALHR